MPNPTASADQAFLDEFDRKLRNGRLDGVQRLVYDTLPKGNANFAWVQHFIHHLALPGKAGLAFGTAFENRRTMQTFVSHIAWESEGGITEDPDHMIHFNGERFLGPYPDAMPTNP